VLFRSLGKTIFSHFSYSGEAFPLLCKSLARDSVRPFHS
jgi:hypothetical protein